ncbi:hypothetical protein [Pseudomonas sp. 210_17 TE3656]
MEESKYSNTAANMTPATLMAIVEDNSRSFEVAMNKVRQQVAGIYERQMLMEQDVIASLQDKPSAQLGMNSSLEFEVRQAVRERQLEYSRLREQLRVVEQEVAQSLQAFRAVQKEREALDIRVRRELEKTPAYINLTQQLQQAIERQPQIVSNYAVILQECTDKLPAFYTNPYYRFLRERNFDTEHYPYGRFNRMLDEWLAKRINFRQNYRNEQILLAMRDHVETAQGNQHTQAAILNEQLFEHTTSALRQAGLEGLSIRIKLLAKQIVLTKERSDNLYDQLEAFIHGEDPQAEDIFQWLSEQLGQRDIDEVLEQVARFSPADSAWATHQRQTLRDLYVEIETLRESEDQAIQIYKTAMDLECALRDSLAAERSCEEHCDCECHNPPQCYCNDFCTDDCNCKCHRYCACDYNYDVAYSYQQTLDYQELIANYMKGNLTLNDLMKLFERERESLPHMATTRATVTDCIPS